MQFEAFMGVSTGDNNNRKETTMKNEPLPTNNEEWGFWGTSVSNGFDAALTWDTASRFFAKTFNLTPEETRTLLDARFGRHLADDLSFINGGPATAQAIITHLEKRYADKGWRRHFEKAIREETGKRIPYSEPKSKAEILTAIAQEHLNFETLEERKSDSLDFKDVGVLNVKAALEAAYAAGQASRKGA
jgi:hypothetical protein